MRSLTIPQAAASTNIWFKVESEEQQRMFQEEFFRQGGVTAEGKAWDFFTHLGRLYITVTGGLCNFKGSTGEEEEEEVQIIWQEEEPSISIDSLAPETTLAFTFDTSKSWPATLTLLTQLKNEELVKDFISDKCLRRMEDAQLASLAMFLLETEHGAKSLIKEDLDSTEKAQVVKAFILTTKNFLTKRTKQLEYWYKFYRKEVENIVRSCQAGLYQEELKQSPEWEGLSWERRGEFIDN